MIRKSKGKLKAYGHHQKKGFKQINQIFGVFSYLVVGLLIEMEVMHTR